MFFPNIIDSTVTDHKDLGKESQVENFRENTKQV